jgi:hypothetical protein
MTTKVKVFTKTYLRTGGFLDGPDNRIGADPLPPGEYEARAQCPGQEIKDGAHNYWWVRLATPRGEGWVTAVHVATGDDDEPIPPVNGVPIPLRPTVFVAEGITDEPPLVRVWKETPLRRGGSTKDPDNHIGQDYLPIGEYRALAQCAGEAFADGDYHNYWWVHLGTDWGGPGWVTAVHLATGENDKPIPPVDGVLIPELSTVMVV